MYPKRATGPPNPKEPSFRAYVTSWRREYEGRVPVGVTMVTDCNGSARGASGKIRGYFRKVHRSFTTTASLSRWKRSCASGSVRSQFRVHTRKKSFPGLSVHRNRAFHPRIRDSDSYCEKNDSTTSGVA